MTPILKPSQLKNTISELNKLIEDYGEQQTTITDQYKLQLDERRLSFNTQNKLTSDKSETNFNELEEKFKTQSSDIKHKHRNQFNTLQKQHNEKVALLRQAFEERSESIRWHSAEILRNERTDVKSENSNLLAEHDSINDLLNDREKFCQQALPIAKKSGNLQKIKSLTEVLFPDIEDEDELNDILKNYEASENFDKLEELYGVSQPLLQKLKSSRINRFFLKLSPILSFILLVLIHVAIIVVGKHQSIDLLKIEIVGVSFLITAGLFGIVCLIHLLTSSKALKTLGHHIPEILEICKFCRLVNDAQLKQNTSNEKAQLHSLEKLEDLKIEEELRKIEVNHLVEIDALNKSNQSQLHDLEAIAKKATDKITLAHSQKIEAMEAELDEQIQKLQKEFKQDSQAINDALNNEVDQMSSVWQEKWGSKLESFENRIQESRDHEALLFPSWQNDLSQWNPPSKFEGAVPFGRLQMDLAKELDFSENSCLELNEAVPFAIPALLEYPGTGSLCVSANEQNHDKAIQVLKNTVLRLLMTLPPGKSRFSFIDPLALGETFAGFMHLNDYKESLTGGRISTKTRQIDQQLTDLTDHMETVIQKYLRNEFENICEYNDAVGEIAEPFRFLAIADFPLNFSDDAVKKLISIATSGARCGVYLIMLYDTRHKIPGNYDINELKKHCVFIEENEGELQWHGTSFKHTSFTMEALPPVSTMNDIIKQVGSASISSSLVEIPFEKVAYPDQWTGDSTEDLEISIGLTGTRHQMLTFGHGTAQHCLIAGKTGSGKSNLLHVIICNLALKYSPDELNFYLIDFKKGVEFKAYALAQLPHAKAIAIESDREFGLSILRKIDQELQDRGEILRQNNAQNSAQYRKHTGEKMARILLVIDEFQEIFVEDDMIAQEANLLLDRIVRQGRAFGMHVLLGSQTLAGNYSIARTTMGQMGIRIALQCSESDSYVILNENNNAARLLSRPGEAIYNDHAGLPEHNTPFQTPWLPDDTKGDCLNGLRQSGDGRLPFVFEGNQPADINNCMSFHELLKESKKLNEVYLGEPNAIRPALSLKFEATAGQNLLITGQKEESSLAMMIACLSSLAIQFKGSEAQFDIFDGSSQENPRGDYLESIQACLEHETTINTPATATPRIATLHEELQQRIGGEVTSPRFVLIHGLQRFRKLKQEDSFSWNDDEKSPGAQLAELIAQGPEYHMYFIVWCDSWNNFLRICPRKILSEFEYRVLFQMGQNDSVNLIDSPSASKLELHTALLYNEQSGDSVKFRPFSLPNKQWMETLESSFK